MILVICYFCGPFEVEDVPLRSVFSHFETAEHKAMVEMAEKVDTINSGIDR